MLLLASGRYRSHRTTSLVGEAWSLIKLGVAATLLFTLSIYLFRLDALLLTSRTGSALYVAAVDAPRMIQRPLARGTTVRWRAAAHRDGGLYRLYAAPEGEEMRLVSEQEARVGMTDYAVSVPQAEGETSLYELRYVSPAGEETMLQSLLVHDLISRMLILLSGVLATVLLLAQTLAVRGLAHYVRRRGYNFRQVVIVGTGQPALEIAASIATHRYWGLKVFGFVDVGESSTPGVAPILGSQEDLPRLAEEQVIDQVIFATARQRFDDLEDLVLQLEELGIATCFALNLFPNTNAKAQLAEMGGTPVVTFSTGPTNQLQLFVKRLLDVAVSAVAVTVI